MQAHNTCTCFHDSTEHVRRTGRCKSTDSYGCPCACPSFEHDTNLDDDTDD